MTLVCPSAQIVTEKGCEIALDNYTADTNLVDGCTDLSIYTFTQSPVAGINLVNGIYTVNITVTDINNNTANCNFLLEVDLILPTVPTISGN